MAKGLNFLLILSFICWDSAFSGNWKDSDFLQFSDTSFISFAITGQISPQLTNIQLQKIYPANGIKDTSISLPAGINNSQEQKNPRVVLRGDRFLVSYLSPESPSTLSRFVEYDGNGAVTLSAQTSSDAVGANTLTYLSVAADTANHFLSAWNNSGSNNRVVVYDHLNNKTYQLYGGNTAKIVRIPHLVNLGTAQYLLSFVEFDPTKVIKFIKLNASASGISEAGSIVKITDNQNGNLGTDPVGAVDQNGNYVLVFRLESPTPNSFHLKSYNSGFTLIDSQDIEPAINYNTALNAHSYDIESYAANEYVISYEVDNKIYIRQYNCSTKVLGARRLATGQGKYPVSVYQQSRLYIAWSGILPNKAVRSVIGNRYRIEGTSFVLEDSLIAFSDSTAGAISGLDTNATFTNLDLKVNSQGKIFVVWHSGDATHNDVNHCLWDQDSLFYTTAQFVSKVDSIPNLTALDSVEYRSVYYVSDIPANTKIKTTFFVGSSASVFSNSEVDSGTSPFSNFKFSGNKKYFKYQADFSSSAPPVRATLNEFKFDYNVKPRIRFFQYQIKNNGFLNVAGDTLRLNVLDSALTLRIKGEDPDSNQQFLIDWVLQPIASPKQTVSSDLDYMDTTQISLFPLVGGLWPVVVQGTDSLGWQSVRETLFLYAHNQRPTVTTFSCSSQFINQNITENSTLSIFFGDSVRFKTQVTDSNFTFLKVQWKQNGNLLSNLDSITLNQAEQVFQKNYAATNLSRIGEKDTIQVIVSDAFNSADTVLFYLLIRNPAPQIDSLRAGSLRILDQSFFLLTLGDSTTIIPFTGDTNFFKIHFQWFKNGSLSAESTAFTAAGRFAYYIAPESVEGRDTLQLVVQDSGNFKDSFTVYLQHHNPKCQIRRDTILINGSATGFQDTLWLEAGDTRLFQPMISDSNWALGRPFVGAQWGLNGSFFPETLFYDPVPAVPFNYIADSAREIDTLTYKIRDYGGARDSLILIIQIIHAPQITAYQTFSVRDTSAIIIPTKDSVAVKSVINTLFNLVISASDSDSDIVRYEWFVDDSLTTIHNNNFFSDSFSFTPDSLDSWVKVKVYDGSAVDSLVFELFFTDFFVSLTELPQAESVAVAYQKNISNRKSFLYHLSNQGNDTLTIDSLYTRDNDEQWLKIVLETDSISINTNRSQLKARSLFPGDTLSLRLELSYAALIPEEQVTRDTLFIFNSDIGWRLVNIPLGIYPVKYPIIKRVTLADTTDTTKTGRFLVRNQVLLYFSEPLDTNRLSPFKDSVKVFALLRPQNSESSLDIRFQNDTLITIAPVDEAFGFSDTIRVDVPNLLYDKAGYRLDLSHLSQLLIPGMIAEPDYSYSQDPEIVYFKFPTQTNYFTIEEIGSGSGASSDTISHLADSLSVHFSRPLNPATISAQSFSVSSQRFGTIPIAQIVVSSDLLNVILIPEKKFRSGMDAFVYGDSIIITLVDTTVEDFEGNLFNLSARRSWTLETADNPFQVFKISPPRADSAKAENLTHSIYSSVRIEFTLPIDTSRFVDLFENRTFYLRSPLAGEIKFKNISISPDLRVITIIPARPFYSQDSIFVTVYGHVFDTNGYSLESNGDGFGEFAFTPAAIGKGMKNPLAKVQAFDAAADDLQIFFLTDDGELYVYPNPYKPNSGLGHDAGGVIFKNIHALDKKARSIQLKVYNVAGDIVSYRSLAIRQGSVVFPSYQWDVRNNGGFYLGTGLYVYVFQSESGSVLAKGLFTVIR